MRSVDGAFYNPLKHEPGGLQFFYSGHCNSHTLMDIQQLLSQDPIAKGWTIDTRNTYLAFYQRLTKSTPLMVRIGKGGLSFYKRTKSGLVFLVHFNAMPQRGRYDLGFADFRFDALRQHMNVDTIVRALQKAAPPDIQIKVNKLWCSLHFPLTLADNVADLLTQHIIAKVN